jgi:hypothetical protein
MGGKILCVSNAAWSLWTVHLLSISHSLSKTVHIV